MVELILFIIAAVMVITEKSTVAGIAKREYTKDRIQMLMYQPVYVDGLPFESVRVRLLSDWKAHPILFRQYYDEAIERRKAELEAGVHPLSEKIENRNNTNLMLLIGVLFIILIFNEIYD
jgi:hypothetical protein